MEGIERLPDEVLLRIFSYLSIPERARLRCVSKRWKRLSLDKRIWNFVAIEPRNSTNHLCKKVVQSIGSRGTKSLKVSQFSHNKVPSKIYSHPITKTSWSTMFSVCSQLTEIALYDIMDLNELPLIELPATLQRLRIERCNSTSPNTARNLPSVQSVVLDRLELFSVTSSCVPILISRIKLLRELKRWRLSSHTTTKPINFSAVSPNICHLDLNHTSLAACWKGTAPDLRDLKQLFQLDISGVVFVSAQLVSLLSSLPDSLQLIKLCHTQIRSSDGCQPWFADERCSRIMSEKTLLEVVDCRDDEHISCPKPEIFPQ